MKQTIDRLQRLLNTGAEYFLSSSEVSVSRKESSEKWSKKEELGHLIDSGISNLQRFTEIQFEDKPYKIRKYNQNALVIANDYQHAAISELIELWTAVNHRILKVMEQQTEETLGYAVELEREVYSDLRFLMNDYVDHMEHHLNKIFEVS